MSALVASLFAVGASPAAAITNDSEANSPSPTSACVGPALADAGFTDLGTLDAAKKAINCLAYYRITAGKTHDTFDPNSNVTRGEMALFLMSTAKAAGIDLMGGDGDADFGDISELAENRQNAITSLARNGIMSGRSDMAFEPHADITRAEMAVALVSLIAHVPGARVSKNSNGTFSVGDPGDDDVFGDAFASVSAPVNSAITAAYELGITSGTGDGTTFSPSRPVPRRDMATFITAALAHTNARPAGLTAQADENIVVVSVRDANFQPVANAVIDAFHAATANADKAFRPDGTCAQRTGSSTPTEAGTTKCTIDRLDPGTDSQGNLDLSPVTPAAKGSTVWVWTGETGDKVSATTELYEVDISTGPTDTSGAVRRASVKRDLDDGLTARFGTTVTYAIQLEAGLQDDGTAAAAAADADKWVAVGPDDGGDTYRVTITFPAGTDIKTLEVDEDGQASFSLTTPNPTARQDADVTLSFVMVGVPVEDDTTTSDVDESSPVPAIDGADDDGGSDNTALEGSVTFSETKPRPHAIAVMPVNEYSPAADPPDNPATGNAFIVTVTDQYGDPLGNVRVTATSNRADSGSGVPGTARYTRSNGQVRISYAYTGAAQSELISVEYDGDAADESDTECSNAASNPGNDVCGDTTVYWTVDATDDVSANAMLTADVDANTVVIDVSGAPTVVEYDANDQFVDSRDTATNITLANFEEILAGALEPGATKPSISATGYTGDAEDVARFTLTS